jgi:NAD(P)-dependent dehydrogenase (short-subunit alcohol dehydrogenase family)
MQKYKISYTEKKINATSYPVETGSYLVTGSTGTIGLEICRNLVSNPGCTVYAGVKSANKFDQSALSSLPGVIPVILGEEKLIRHQGLFTSKIQIDGVIHCEGTYGEIGSINEINIDSWIRYLSINLGRTLELIKWMSSGDQTKQIASIFLGGGGASEAYLGLSNYSVMKSSLTRIIETTALEIPLSKMAINILGPGPTDSKMVSDILASNNEVDSRIKSSSISLRNSQQKTSDKVFNAIGFLFSDEGRKISGRFFSAEWDDFENLLLDDTNSYKLRRVISIV